MIHHIKTWSSRELDKDSLQDYSVTLYPVSIFVRIGRQELFFIRPFDFEDTGHFVEIDWVSAIGVDT